MHSQEKSGQNNPPSFLEVQLNALEIKSDLEQHPEVIHEKRAILDQSPLELKLFRNETKIKTKNIREQIGHQEGRKLLWRVIADYFNYFKLVPLATVAVVCVLFVFVSLQYTSEPPSQDVLRFKSGGLIAAAYVNRLGKTSLFVENTAKPGDRIQFEVFSDKASTAFMVPLDASGNLLLSMDEINELAVSLGAGERLSFAESLEITGESEGERVWILNCVAGFVLTDKIVNQALRAAKSVAGSPCLEKTRIQLRP